MGHDESAEQETCDRNQAGPLKSTESADGMTAGATIGPTCAKSNKHSSDQQKSQGGGIAPGLRSKQDVRGKGCSRIIDALARKRSAVFGLMMTGPGLSSANRATAPPAIVPSTNTRFHDCDFQSILK